MFINYYQVMGSRLAQNACGPLSQSEYSDALSAAREQARHGKEEQPNPFAIWQALLQPLSEPLTKDSAKVVLSFTAGEGLEKGEMFASFKSEDPSLLEWQSEGGDMLLYLLDQVPALVGRHYPILMIHPDGRCACLNGQGACPSELVVYLTQAQCKDFVGYQRAKKIRASLIEADLFSDWIQIGPDNKPLNMVLMLNKEFDSLNEQRHFAIHVFDGVEFTKFAPEWLREAHRGITVRSW